MTRKEELQTRADLLSRQLGSGHGGKPIILKALQQVEREVWERVEQQAKENQALREALQDVLLDLQIILPMAKGYAHEHPVGNNKDKVYGVDAVIEQAQQALKEVS